MLAADIGEPDALWFRRLHDTLLFHGAFCRIDASVGCTHLRADTLRFRSGIRSVMVVGGDSLPVFRPEGTLGAGLVVQLLLPLLVFLEDLQACVVVPAIAIAPFVADFRQVVALDAVAVAKEGTVVLQGVEAGP